MSLGDITILEFVEVMGWLALMLILVYTVLWLISKIISWAWWKKENRQYLRDWWYFLDHKNEMLEYIKNRKQKQE